MPAGNASVVVASTNPPSRVPICMGAKKKILAMSVAIETIRYDCMNDRSKASGMAMKYTSKHEMYLEINSTKSEAKKSFFRLVYRSEIKRSISFR